MLRKLLLLTVLVLCVGTGVLLVLSQRRPGDVGPVHGGLREVGSPGHGVCSQVGQEPTRVEPLYRGPEHQRAWAELQLLLVERPGVLLVRVEGPWMHAECRGRWLPFVDDLECLWDPADEVIHVRSAVRVRPTDLGTNRARVEALRAELAARL